MIRCKKKASSVSVLVGALATALVLSGCSGAATEEGEGAVQIDLAIAPDVFFAPLYIAEEKGFFEDAGLDVIRTDYASSVETGQALITGQADMTAGSFLAAAALAKAAPDRMKVLGGYLQADEWWGVVVSKDIKKPEDLAGLAVATQFGAQSEMFINDFMEQHDLNDVEVRDTKFPQLVPAFANGEFPAIVTFEPNVERALQAVPGSHVLEWGSDNDLAVVYGLIEVSSDVFEDPETAQKITQAMNATAKWMAENPEEAASIVANTTGLSEEDASMLLDRLTLGMSYDEVWVNEIDRSLAFLASKDGSDVKVNAADIVMDPADTGLEGK